MTNLQASVCIGVGCLVLWFGTLGLAHWMVQR